MSRQDDESTLHVVDTSKALTMEELQELKRLAALSKGAKLIAAIILGAVSLLGADKIIDILSRHH